MSLLTSLDSGLMKNKEYIQLSFSQGYGAKNIK